MLLALLLATSLAQDVARGEVLAGLGGCVACHTADEGVPLAGGHGIETTFGTFYGTNLTPDPVHGLGGWSFEDFERAMRQGIRPDGKRYYPSFPYPWFARISDADLADLWAWLQAQPADPTPDRPHELTGIARARSSAASWRFLHFRPGRAVVDPASPPDVLRGAELVEGIGHCGACHTPMGGQGAPKRKHHLAGARTGPAPGPNITPHPEGLGSWSADELDDLLIFGLTPTGDVVGGEMWRIVEEGTAVLSASDRAAIIAYLRAIEPKADP